MKTIVWFVLLLSALSAAGKEIQGKPGQKATIECGVNDYYHTLGWDHGMDQIININRKTGFPRKGKSVLSSRSTTRGTSLVISKMTEEDTGQFTCTADGTSWKHTLFVLLVSVSPSGELQLGSKATLQCHVKGLNPDPPVQWKSPHESEPTGSDPVHLKTVAFSDAGTWVCMFSYAGATYSETLDIKVKGLAPNTTTMPPSKPAKDISVPAPPSSDTLGQLGLSWWVWVAIAVGGLVVVFLMVLVIVLCKRIKRRKIRLLKMKNARHPLKAKQYCQCGPPAAAAKPQQGRRREKPSALPLQPLLTE